MKVAVEEAPQWIEWTDAERAEIVGETNRILADPAFKNSKRCQALFRFLVDRSLAGEPIGIKERTLGVEVFGRSPDYDTAVDPVVRITANEIRKRLAQWYQEPAHHQRVRVRLVVGTYLLKFDFVQHEPLAKLPEPLNLAKAGDPAEDRDLAAANEVQPESQAELQQGLQTGQPSIGEESAHQTAVANASPAASETSSRRKWYWLAAAIVVLAAAGIAGGLNSDLFSSKSDLVWKPFLGSSQPLTLSVPDTPPIVIPDGDTNWKVIADAISNREVPTDLSGREGTSIATPLTDAEVAQDFTGWLALHAQKSVLRGASSVSLRDLRESPVVLIGGFNPWSLILLSKLRYSIRVDPVTHSEWIQDAQNASNRDWIIRNNFEPNDVDYAVVSRFIDSETGHWILSVGGLRSQGTQAAADLLTNRAFTHLLPSQINSTSNFEIVIKTNFINGGAGPPQILAVHTW